MINKESREHNASLMKNSSKCINVKIILIIVQCTYWGQCASGVNNDSESIMSWRGRLSDHSDPSCVECAAIRPSARTFCPRVPHTEGTGPIAPASDLQQEMGRCCALTGNRVREPAFPVPHTRVGL